MFYIHYYDKECDTNCLIECDSEEVMLNWVGKANQNEDVKIFGIIEGKRIELEPVEVVTKFRVKK